MERAANWPIRVGGEYAAKSGTSIYRRITAIDDGEVHYMVCSRGGASDDDFPGELSASSFRRLHHPEDQSPLPALIEALKGCDDAFAHWQMGTVPGRPEDILALITQVRDALAKVTVSEPVPEEVAA